MSTKRPSDELLDKYWDFFKQIATLDLAAAVILLAIFRDSVGRIQVVGALVPLLTSLALCIVGMMEVRNHFDDRARRDSGERLVSLYKWVARTFVLGMLTLAAITFLYFAVGGASNGG
jgi:hypothetical protein